MRCGFHNGAGALFGFNRIREGGRVFHEDAAADEAHHVDKHAFKVPFVCGARNL
ncbi:MAG: hypothetical protein WA859_21580, partial [Candidatus Sulfotelmatobacter sp.]